jgi:hypothetical protein
MFKDFGNFLFESTDSEERQKEKDQAEKLKKAKAAAADAKSKLDSTENDKEASDEDRAKAKLIYIKNTAIVTQLESDAKLKALEDSVKEDVNESFADTIKDLFKRTPVETKLLKSLDIFTDELLSPGQGKFDFVIKRAKEFGMDIDQDQAFKILQKRLAMEIEDLEESVDGSKVVKSDPMNEGVLVIAAGVILGLMGLKLLKVITKKVLGTIGMNVKIEPEKLKSILSKIVKETMFEAGGMLGSDFIQIAIIERQIASKIDNGEITTIGGIMAEFESLTKD